MKSASKRTGKQTQARRTQIGLLLLLVVFVGLAVLTAQQANPSPTPTPDWRENYIFPDVTVRDIVTVNLRDPNTNTTFTLSRDAEGNWTAPGRDGVLNTEIASSAAQSIVLIDFQRTIPMADDLRQYGFNPNGTLFIELLLADETPHVIAVGGLTNDRQAYYLLVDDRPELYISLRGPIDYVIQVFRDPPIKEP